MSELKPCPFCGKPLHVFYNYRLKAWTWHCDTENCAGTMLGYDSEDEAVSALNRRAQPANDPLTLEQLREMDREPVWVVPNRGIAKWYLVDVANDCCSTCDMDVVDFELYGPKNMSYGWLAYRRPPERRKNDVGRI